jgi:phosphoribosyl-AMP cyclohydrolase
MTVAGDTLAAQVTGLKYNEAGLVCAVAQQHDTGEVLMVAWMDAEAVRLTVETGRATYFSRSRNRLWVKGETSGHTQRVVEVRKDCDGDALLVLVDQTGAACHTGAHTCFDDGLISLADRAGGYSGHSGQILQVSPPLEIA